LTETVVTARKWGNSIGFTLPMETVLKERIKANDMLVITIQKASPIKDLFGLIKTKKSTQSIKDELRKGWD